MAVTCKMCGYTVQIAAGQQFGICEACGSPAAIERTAAEQTANAERLAPLLKRAFLSLEYAEWQKADELLEQALNLDPENALIYVAKLMAQLRISKEEDLGNHTQELSNYLDYQKALRFADADLKERLEQYNAKIIGRLRQAEEERKKQAQEQATENRTFIPIFITVIVIVIAFIVVMSIIPTVDHPTAPFFADAAPDHTAPNAFSFVYNESGDIIYLGMARTDVESAFTLEATDGTSYRIRTHTGSLALFVRFDRHENIYRITVSHRDWFVMGDISLGTQQSVVEEVFNRSTSSGSRQLHVSFAKNHTPTLARSVDEAYRIWFNFCETRAEVTGLVITRVS